jgi:hypothetical protein
MRARTSSTGSQGNLVKKAIRANMQSVVHKRGSKEELSLPHVECSNNSP